VQPGIGGRGGGPHLNMRERQPPRAAAPPPRQRPLQRGRGHVGGQQVEVPQPPHHALVVQPLGGGRRQADLRGRAAAVRGGWGASSCSPFEEDEARSA
jgi:hypothetical protein